ncbi:hypothetical protein FHS52_002340 [Erythromicrobium ramosum]|uniref:Uncharacterized protein n=1 Tax=Erythrobacter ramosus TaxID=35811 RepID=A0A6I4UJ48_9SPHN|nr:hypothetical protein [Erythrobacter ramosus]MBB3776371.1 hypothetical protein [Erythrobacter ramosus]MXP38548.1 hypothetical protein [Erythrobacter ramosus]
MLANEARRLQQEARDALEQGNYTRASALIGDAELLAEDVHHLVSELERHEIGGLMMLDDYDVREVALRAPSRLRIRFALPPRRVRVALGASFLMSLALTEW